jgi:hypothetical protein
MGAPWRVAGEEFEQPFKFTSATAFAKPSGTGRIGRDDLA